MLYCQQDIACKVFADILMYFKKNMIQKTILNKKDSTNHIQNTCILSTEVVFLQKSIPAKKRARLYQL